MTDTAALSTRIPGWGVDRDPADRPSVPREFPVDGPRSVGYDAVPRQPEEWPRERSIEHGELTPVFGTTCPPRGLSGVIRRFAYSRFSEARAAHWLLLVAADRVDATEHHITSLFSGRPDNPITETGILSEFKHHPIRSRVGQHRVDLVHNVLDPPIIFGPWLLAAGLGAAAVNRIVRMVRGNN